MRLGNTTIKYMCLGVHLLDRWNTFPVPELTHLKISRSDKRAVVSLWNQEWGTRKVRGILKFFRARRVSQKGVDPRPWCLLCAWNGTSRQVPDFYCPVSAQNQNGFLIKRSRKHTIKFYLFQSCSNLFLFRNSGASVWAPPNSSRFVKDRSTFHDNPEPGTYNPSDVDSASGHYIVSKFKNLGFKTFGTPR